MMDLFGLENLFISDSKNSVCAMCLSDMWHQPQINFFIPPKAVSTNLRLKMLMQIYRLKFTELCLSSPGWKNNFRWVEPTFLLICLTYFSFTWQKSVCFSCRSVSLNSEEPTCFWGSLENYNLLSFSYQQESVSDAPLALKTFTYLG